MSDSVGRVRQMCFHRLLLGVLSLFVISAVVGCVPSYGRSVEERRHTYKSVTRAEWQMAQDDFDSFMLSNRKSRLTRWH